MSMSTTPKKKTRLTSHFQSVQVADGAERASPSPSRPVKLAGYARRHAMVVPLANFGGASGGLATGELLVQLGPDGPAVGVVTGNEPGLDRERTHRRVSQVACCRRRRMRSSAIPAADAHVSTGR
jgi:hypothetical protein